MSSSSVPKNPPPLKPGMDNPWYDYAPFPKRPKLTWPKQRAGRLLRACCISNTGS